MWNTNDIYKEFLRKYDNNEFRIIGNDVQQSKTLEIQNAHFEVDKLWIVREPNYEYYMREEQWYLSKSLNVNDIPGGAPTMWKKCADKDGFVNSNYGWCIFSEENGNQFENCAQQLINDPHTREAIMIYNRPSMQQEYNKNGMHDFMCCQNVQYFLNDSDIENQMFLDCIVNFRSNDAIFGFNNDVQWMSYVQTNLAEYIESETGKYIMPRHIYWNAGSLHIYERHFDILTSFETRQYIYNYYHKRLMKKYLN